MRLTLGSGAQVTLEQRALPAAFGVRRVIAAELQAGEAIRDAAALDASGAVVGRAVVGTAPSGQPCVGEDQGERLCVALGSLRPRVCPPPPVGSDHPRLHLRDGVVGER